MDDVPPVAAGVDDGVCVFYDSEGEAGVFHLSSDFVDWTAHPNLIDNCPEIVADRAFTCGQETTLSDSWSLHRKRPLGLLSPESSPPSPSQLLYTPMWQTH